jgi:hypothetical protein
VFQETPLERRERVGGCLPVRSLAEVDPLDIGEPFTQGADRAAELLPDWTCGGPPLFSGRQQHIRFTLERHVIGTAGSSKRGHYRVVAVDVERVCRKYRGLSSRGHDLFSDPFEIFAALGRVRQDVHRVAARDRADLL